jgi:alpha-1,6-mannosyltransferase
VLDIAKYWGATGGGISTYLLEKARYVAVRPWLRQVMVIPGARDEIVTKPGSRTYRLRGPRVPAQPPYRFLFATTALRRIVEHERPELIEVGSPILVPWLARLANRRLAAPMIWHCHDHFPGLADPNPEAGTRWRRLVAAGLRHYVRMLGSRFPAVICGSDYAVAELTRLGVARPTRVPLGVDLEVFHPRRRAWATETRRGLGLPDERLALYAGRFASEKRLDVVLDAWPEIERRARIRLVLLGTGPVEERLRAHRYGPRVIWLPGRHHRASLADLLAAVDIYVAPGPVETGGRSILEALGSGTPVLSVDEGAGRELVAGARAGERYRDGDPGHAADAAIWLAKQNLTALGRRGRSHVERYHGWDTVFDQLFAAYHRVRTEAAG